MILFSHHPFIRKQQIKAVLLYWFYLPALVLGSGKLVDLLGLFPTTHRFFAGLAGLVTGGLIIGRATTELTTVGRGTPSPFQPPKKLVTTGIYRFCRHPMWLGYDILALGCILILGSPGALWFSFPLFITGQLIYLQREEKILTARFAGQYPVYQRTTGMLLPRFPRRTVEL